MKKLLVCLLLLCSGSVMAESKFGGTPVPEQKVYLCIPEITSGFKYNENTKSWEGADLKTRSSTKYLVKVNDKEYLAYYATVSLFGNKNPSYYCEDEDNYSVDVISCNSYDGQFVFNHKTLRFLWARMLGYIDGADNNDNTPHIQGGTCSPL